LIAMGSPFPGSIKIPRLRAAAEVEAAAYETLSPSEGG
jgi:hypothetical protein